jgi:hypothetical protein
LMRRRAAALGLHSRHATTPGPTTHRGISSDQRRTAAPHDQRNPCHEASTLGSLREGRTRGTRGWGFVDVGLTCSAPVPWRAPAPTRCGRASPRGRAAVGRWPRTALRPRGVLASGPATGWRQRSKLLCEKSTYTSRAPGRSRRIRPSAAAGSGTSWSVRVVTTASKPPWSGSHEPTWPLR